MQRIAYEIYYDQNAMMKDNPLHNQLSDDMVKHNIERLPIEFETILDDESSSVSIGKSTRGNTILFVTSEEDESTIDECMEKALEGLSLVGRKLEDTSEHIVR